jgi:DNA-directed RNA polymerase specialized sigma24 family protein
MNAKKLLTQYTDLQAEIKDLEKRIKKLENFKVEHDKVTGSENEFPYIKRSFKIEGYNIQDIDRLNELKELLIDRKNQCEEFKLQIEKFISNIPDSRTRRVFQYRYIDGLSWLQIARRIGKYEESYPRKVIHDKYLEGLKDERGVNQQKDLQKG